MSKGNGYDGRKNYGKQADQYIAIAIARRLAETNIATVAAMRNGGGTDRATAIYAAGLIVAASMDDGRELNHLEVLADAEAKIRELDGGKR